MARLYILALWALALSSLAGAALVHAPRGAALLNASVVDRCPGGLFDQGQWVRRMQPAPAACAAVGQIRARSSTSDSEVVARASQWRWQPPADCALVRPSRLELARRLVERGGVMIVGDSTARGQLKALVCELGDMVDRVAAAGRLVDGKLLEASYVLSSTGARALRLEHRPPQPLLSYYRSDFGFARTELLWPLKRLELPDIAEALQTSIRKHSKDIDPPIATWLDPFTDVTNRYAVVVFNTGLHWSRVAALGPTSGEAALQVVLELWIQTWARVRRPGQIAIFRPSMPAEAPCRAGVMRPLDRPSDELPTRNAYQLAYNALMEVRCT